VIWSPATRNGWNPTISPDGRRVAFGFGEVFVADVGGAERRVADGWPAGWLDNTHLGVTQSIDGNPDARRLLVVDVESGATRDSGVPPETMPTVCAGGRIFGGKGRDLWQYWIDGAPLTVSGLWGDPVVSPGGRYMLQAQPGMGWRLGVVDVERGMVTRTVSAQSAAGAAIWEDPNGDAWVTFTRGARMWVAAPDGREWAVPSHVDEWAGGLTWRGGEPWAWSWCGLGANEQYFVVGRPLGSAEGVVLPMAGIGLALGPDVVAGTDAAGLLTVATDLPWAQRADPRQFVTPFDWPIAEKPWPSRCVWGWLGDADAPGTVVSGADTTTGRAVIEGPGTYDDGSPWLRAQDRPRLLAVFTSPADSRDWPAERDAALKLARATGAPVLVYDDKPLHDTDADGNHRERFARMAEADWFREQGCGVVAGVQVYPTEGNAGWQIANWHEPNVNRLHEAGYPVVLVQAGYQQSAKWSLKGIAAMLDATDDLARRHPGVIGTLRFGWKRDAQQPRELVTWLAKRDAASTAARPQTVDRSVWPRTSAPTVATAPEPTPELVPVEPAPVEPTPEPRKPGKAPALAWAPPVAAAIFGFVKWLRRKK
jgi:hypothetical protein